MELSLYGSSGFVGSVFKDYFLNSNSDNSIYIVDRSSLEPIISRKFNREAFKNDVLYLISTVDNYNVHTDPTLDVRTNLLLLTQLLEFWKESRTTFNFVSSWFVYGNNNNPLSKETDYCNPNGFYSITKRCAEQLIISYAETYGLEYRILRLANVIGPNAPFSEKKNALQYLANRIENNEPIDLYEGGIFCRNYIDVEDCARAIDLVLSNGVKNTIYNIGAYNVFFKYLINILMELTGSKSDIRVIKQKDFHKKVQTLDFMMNTSKLRLLGFEPKYTIQDMMYRILNNPYWER